MAGASDPRYVLAATAAGGFALGCAVMYTVSSSSPSSSSSKDKGSSSMQELVAAIDNLTRTIADSELLNKQPSRIQLSKRRASKTQQQSPSVSTAAGVGGSSEDDASDGNEANYQTAGEDLWGAGETAKALQHEFEQAAEDSHAGGSKKDGGSHDLFQALDAFYADLKYQEGYNLAMKHDGFVSDDVELVWRLARAHANKSSLKYDNEIAERGLELAKRAMHLDTENGNGHKWYALLLGMISNTKPTKEQIAISFEFKEHIEKAIEKLPNDPNAHAVLGMWCYSVANLGWAARKAASLLFGTPPESSFDESLAWHQKAEKIKPRFWKSNTLCIAKNHISMGNKVEARKWLNAVFEDHQKATDDADIEKEAKELLAKV